MKRKWDSPDAAATASVCVDGGGDSSSGAEFEVFLSFRGPDTRLSFTDCLYHSMVGAGIRVFRDDEEIRKGEKIGGELLRAIESSKIYVPIFSRNYASSAWCLRELKHMVECSRKANEKVILPIFYDVNSDDVKLKTPLYLDALKKHEEKFGRDDVREWEEALAEVARIKGWGLRNRGHGEIINAIIDDVLTKLMKRMRNLPDHLVGIHDHVEVIMDLLNISSPEVCYLVIHGMGGIGKTTLASAVFNQISNQFQGCSFLLDVRESAQHGRIIDLQKQLLSEILQAKSLGIHDSVHAGVSIIRERFRDKKILIVLDDVDKWDQLSKLAEKMNWFGPGSKIIITTRDINFLPIKEEEKQSSCLAHSEEFKIYEMTELDSFHALQLFSQHAFRMDFPPHDYDDISRKITHKTGGLPLALEVIGSSLCCKSKEFWKDTLKKLDLVPKQEVINRLKISYDMLEHHQREIFLDIACYFIGKERLYPYYMWKASNYFPKCEVLVLFRMSLVKIVGINALWMHDQVRDLGREIVRREDVNVPGNRSRLWLPKTALDVIQMKEVSENLKVIKISTCKSLKRTPNFSKCLNLKRLVVAGCTTSLVVDGSLSKLERLKYLQIQPHCILLREDRDLYEVPFVLSGPKSLSTLEISNMPVRELHHSIGEMKGLEYLSIVGCCFLRTLPDSIGKLKLLLELRLENTGITELPHSIGDLKMLRKMSLTGTRIKKLPNQIGGLECLLDLDLKGTDISELPSSIANLKRLEILCLDKTAIKELPRAIGMLESLKELKARACQNLEGDIPNEIGGLSFLRILDLRRSMIRRLPMTMNQLFHLQELYLDFCDEFEQIPMLPMSLKVLRLELPMSLKVLRFSSYLLWNAPDLSYLTSLVNLYIYNYASQLSEFRHGAPKIKWIEGLFNLESLTLIARDVTFPLINLATLSRLRILAITCVDSRSLGGLPSSLEELSLYDVKSPMERSLFSNLTNLSQLALYKCWLREVDFDEVLGQQLVKLHRLEVMDNELLERLSVSRLTGLQEL
ncbi:disease resistance protein RUN1-like isoform X3 [Eucalyptus grandis]|uniref:disease resistance protein RUN1-like isoform X3 n=1 Tax=Eucalyptus grandis TaxID=71139 RepID=UPI00192EADF1|nr:disease resistance protein RUN1-like isoform X3 [Eucalyptus grandis]